MRICLISYEIFAWGKCGAIGRAIRTIGRELVKRGYPVTVVVPRRPGQAAVKDHEGIRVLGFSPHDPLSALACLRSADADIYHSFEPSFTSWLAIRAMPERKHMLTLRDPRVFTDWCMELALPSSSRLQVARKFLIAHNPLTTGCIRRMDAVFTTAQYPVPKVRRMYRLDHDPVFLPTPVAVPERVEKAARPTVCYLARLDRRKGPRLFLDLAARFPKVHFIATGRPRSPAFEAELRRAYGALPNLEMPGFIEQIGHRRDPAILDKSWILVDTETRQTLPDSFLEATAHRCAIMSLTDPDGFASEFGFPARHDDLADGLHFLLERDRWRVRGERGHAHIRDLFETSRAIDRHVAAYQRLLRAGRGAALYLEPTALVGASSPVLD